jgi:dipeptidase E
MKLLLTSAGVKNASIHDALVDLLGKPITEANALCIPTATYANPGGAGSAWRFINGRASTPMTELGWKSVGVLELTALPSIGEAHWVRWVQETDVLLVNGGDPLYLNWWMRQSGLAELLPSLRSETVYVGLSAGSMVMAPNIGEDFVRWRPPTGGDETLGLVDFAMFPHLDHEDLPENTMADAEKWAAGMSVPAYAIDDQTAIKVVDGAVDVISEGHWKLFTP